VSFLTGDYKSFCIFGVFTSFCTEAFTFPSEAQRKFEIPGENKSKAPQLREK
jgi:hypothetical protein